MLCRTAPSPGSEQLCSTGTFIPGTSTAGAWLGPAWSCPIGERLNNVCKRQREKCVGQEKILRTIQILGGCNVTPSPYILRNPRYRYRTGCFQQNLGSSTMHPEL